nr:ribonuclease H-like domain-containing protein [Tanacetum cinerariifolium]
MFKENQQSELNLEFQEFPLGNSQNNIDDKGYWDSGCSRHMTGNISYLSDYEPFDGGYVSFGKGGCKITGKGTINTVAKASADENELWHRRLGHLNFKTMNKLVRHNLVRGLPSKCFENDHTCVAFLKGKEHKASCKTKLVHSVSKPLHTLHMDMFGPTSNGVTERRNKTLIEATRTTLADAKLPVTFWAEAVNTACYVQNRVLVNKSQNKTPYELFNGRTLATGFLKPFRCHVMILNTLDNLRKFEAKGDEGYFIGYFMSNKAFRVFNKRTKRVKENLHVDFLENKLIEKGAGPNWLFDIDTLTNSMNYVPVVSAGTTSTNFLGDTNGVEADLSNMENNISASPTHTFRIHKDHPTNQIIGPVDTPVQTRTKSKEMEEQSFIA